MRIVEIFFTVIMNMHFVFYVQLSPDSFFLIDDSKNSSSRLYVSLIPDGRHIRKPVLYYIINQLTIEIFESFLKQESPIKI